MTYADKIKETYWENKSHVDKERKKMGLTYRLNLEDKIRDSYKSYKSFCIFVGVKPKTLYDFLLTEVV